MKLCVVGAGGRMGQALICAIENIQGVKLHSAVDRAGADCIGLNAGILAGCTAQSDVLISDNLDTALEGADGILDFTAPVLSCYLAERASSHKLVHVIGTTGFSEEENNTVATAASGARIVKSGNMSLGVNLLAGLVKKAAAALDEDFDLEILEMHHRHKVDAPSGTALMLGQAAADGRGIDLEASSVRVRDGITGARESGSIGFATLRGGSVVGSHSVLLAGEGERIELSHIAEDRAIFARGAIKAALWAFDKPSGLYAMADVLGLND